jgi:hypothetical protein
LVFNDVRWSLGDRTLIVHLGYISSARTEADDLGVIGIIWAAGTPECAETFDLPGRA